MYRREFLKSLFIYLFGNPLVGCGIRTVNICEPHQNYNKKILDATEKACDKQLIEGQDYCFFSHSSTVQIFQQDTHVWWYNRPRKERLQKLAKELEKKEVSLQAMGLEGIIRGTITNNELRLLNEQKKDIIGIYMEEADKIFNPFFQLSELLLYELTHNKESPLKNIEELNDLLKYTKFSNAMIDYKTYWYEKAAIVDMLLRENGPNNKGFMSPALDYYDDIGDNIILFGLDDPEALQISHSLTSYYILQKLKQKTEEIMIYFTSVTNKLPQDKWQVKIRKVNDTLTTLYTDIKESMEKVICNFPEKMSEPIKQEAIIFDREEELDKKCPWYKYVDYDRTKHWINSVPAGIIGPVLMIGGNKHTESYVEYARKSNQSFIVLPMLKNPYEPKLHENKLDSLNFCS